MNLARLNNTSWLGLLPVPKDVHPSITNWINRSRQGNLLLQEINKKNVRKIITPEMLQNIASLAGYNNFGAPLIQNPMSFM